MRPPGDTFPSERRLLFLLGAVNFVNILDFMIVMPLGPDFARGLRIPPDRLGLIGASYTFAAAIAGLAGARFLDRLDRRVALGASMLGLVIATALGGLATGIGTLMAARVLAGAFGGPATSLSYSILADAVPPERRGRAVGALMGAFSVSSVLGVPLALELARLGSWRTPFLAVALMGLVVAGSAVAVLPPMTGHLAASGAAARAGGPPLWRRPTVLLSWTMFAALMMGNFALIPYISPYVQINLGYPRARLGLLYMVGGAVNFALMRVAGWLADRAGEVPIASFGTALLAVVVFIGFVPSAPLVPVMAIFVGFMSSMAFRAVPLSSLMTRVPEPGERAKFMSTQSAVQHLASAAGGIVASHIVHSAHETAPLTGIPTVALLLIGLAVPVPALMWLVRRRIGPATSRNEITLSAPPKIAAGPPVPAGEIADRG